VIVGPPTAEGRVAFVWQTSAPTSTQVSSADVLLSVYGLSQGAERMQRLVQAAVRRRDLWNRDFDARLDALVSWAGWVVTRIERHFDDEMTGRSFTKHFVHLLVLPLRIDPGAEEEACAFELLD
jgi:hypothetical protein